MQMAQTVMRVMFQPEGSDAVQAVADQVMRAMEQAINKAEQQRKL